ncbi:MAG: G5 domain-containing protein [Clostridia bacterium]|nr:G5 domain-containing protein [Clostridia bacterium]
MPIKTKSGSFSSVKVGLRIISLIFCLIFTLSSGVTVFSVSDKIKVTVVDGNDKVTVYTEQREPRKIVAEAGFDLGSNDKLNIEDFSEKTGGKIIIEHGMIFDFGVKGSPLADFKKAVVRKVRYDLRSENEPIPYSTRTVMDNSLAFNTTKVESKGKNGTKKVLYVDKYVNGELESSEIKSEVVVRKPQDRVIKLGPVQSNKLADYYGNGVPISELKAPSSLKLDSDGSPVNYKKCIKGKATAYAGDEITSTGIVPKPGYIAVDPKEIPYGTELYVVSADGKYVYGYCIAADTGGFVKMGNTDIDLFMNDEQMCRDWGNRKVNIYVL